MANRDQRPMPVASYPSLAPGGSRQLLPARGALPARSSQVLGQGMSVWDLFSHLPDGGVQIGGLGVDFQAPSTAGFTPWGMPPEEELAKQLAAAGIEPSMPGVMKGSNFRPGGTQADINALLNRQATPAESDLAFMQAAQKAGLAPSGRTAGTAAEARLSKKAPEPSAEDIAFAEAINRGRYPGYLGQGMDPTAFGMEGRVPQEGPQLGGGGASPKPPGPNTLSGYLGQGMDPTAFGMEGSQGGSLRGLPMWIYENVEKPLRAQEGPPRQEDFFLARSLGPLALRLMGGVSGASEAVQRGLREASLRMSGAAPNSPAPPYSGIPMGRIPQEGPQIVPAPPYSGIPMGRIPQEGPQIDPARIPYLNLIQGIQQESPEAQAGYRDAFRANARAEQGQRVIDDIMARQAFRSLVSEKAPAPAPAPSPEREAQREVRKVTEPKGEPELTEKEKRLIQFYQDLLNNPETLRYGW